MRNWTKLILGLFLTTLACSHDKPITIKDELLQRWSVSDSECLNFFDFVTISQFDDYQYLNKNFFDSIKVILPLDGYSIELVPEGDKLKNDFLCVYPLREDRIIRFQFTRSGTGLVYNGKRIKPNESKDIVITRLKGAKHPNQQLISLIFEDTINQGFVEQSLDWINDGFLTFVTDGLSPDSLINEINDLDQNVKENLKRYRLCYGVGMLTHEK